jgi:hypothetical protein
MSYVSVGTCIDIFATNRLENVELFNQIDIQGIPTTHDLLYGSYLLSRLPDATDNLRHSKIQILRRC